MWDFKAFSVARRGIYLKHTTFTAVIISLTNGSGFIQIILFKQSQNYSFRAKYPYYYRVLSGGFLMPIPLHHSTILHTQTLWFSTIQVISQSGSDSIRHPIFTILNITKRQSIHKNLLFQKSSLGVFNKPY